jgi:glutathione S-transferase
VAEASVAASINPEVGRGGALWPLKRFPLLLDQGRPVAEATIIIEHLGLHHPGPVRLIPDDPAAALEVRFIDRFFDKLRYEVRNRVTFLNSEHVTAGQ